MKYLSWTYAWSEFKKQCPDANYEIIMFDGKPYLSDENLGYMCMVNVTAGGETRSMWLPVMDGANNAMKSTPYEYTVKNKNFRYAKWDEEKQGYYDSYGNEQPEYLIKKVDAATMFDINKTIMRCLVKCIGMFGLGLYIYAGEDLPEIPKLTDKTKQEALVMKLKECKVTQKELLAMLNVQSMDKLTIEDFNTAMAMLDNYADKANFFKNLCEKEKVTEEALLKVMKCESVDKLSLRGIMNLMDTDTLILIKGKIVSTRTEEDKN